MVKGTVEEEAVLAEYSMWRQGRLQRKWLLGLSNRRKIFGEKLKTEEGQRSVFKIAKQMAKERQDMVGVNCLKDEYRCIVVKPFKPEMLKRWRDYMERLLNVENDWDGIVECRVVEGPSEHITETEVEKVIRQIKSEWSDGAGG